MQDLFVNMEKKIINREKSSCWCGDGGILLGAAQTLRLGLAIVLNFSLFGVPPLSVTLVVSCGCEENPVCETTLC